MNEKDSKRVVLITGASSGIGLETALKLLKKGFTVYGAARRVEKMEPILAAGGNAVFLDFFDENSIRNAVSSIIEKEGRIDVLINNAGFGYGGSIESVPVEKAKKQFDVNVFGLTEITQLVLPYMRRQKSGRIINISSMAGKFSSPFMGWYHASKYCVEALSDSLRLEVQPFGIKVSIVEPGLIQTDWGNIAAENLLESTKNSDYEAAGKCAADFYKKYYSNPKCRITSALAVADTITKAVTARNPKIRYHIGKYSVLFPLTVKLCSSGFVDVLIKKVFGLKEKL